MKKNTEAVFNSRRNLATTTKDDVILSQNRCSDEVGCRHCDVSGWSSSSLEAFARFAALARSLASEIALITSGCLKIS